MPLPAPVRGRQGAAALISKPGIMPKLTGGNARNEQAWQLAARQLAKEEGVVRFAAGITSDAARRCRLTVERYDPDIDDWNAVTDEPKLSSTLRRYRGRWRSTEDLVYTHMWHYQITGECAGILLDDERKGPGNWEIVGWEAIELRNDEVLIMDVPGGRERTDTAVRVPRDRLWRLWVPDDDYPLLATSPMRGVLNELHRYRSLSRYARRTADSRLIMNGVLWTPEAAHVEQPGEQHQPDHPDQMHQSRLASDYYELAARSFNDSNDQDVSSIAPFMMWWDKELGDPKWIPLGQALDPHGIEYRHEALEDFARGYNLPAELIVGGGTSQGNHWSGWLVDEKFFAAGVAPLMDRITHTDLTEMFLKPTLKAEGYDEGDLENLRVGYDPAQVIVREDKSDLALRGWMAGIVSPETVRDEMGFDEENAPTDADLELLQSILAGAPEEPDALVPGDTTAPASPATVTPKPPKEPTQSAPPPLAQQAAAPPVRDVKRMASRLAATRRDTFRRLWAGADVAYEDALRHAGVKATVRARKRSAAVRASVAAAVNADGCLGAPVLAALGLTERELLHQRFDTYKSRARKILSEDAKKRARIVREELGNDAPAGVDERLDDPDRLEKAAGALAAGLLAFTARSLIERPATPPFGEAQPSPVQPGLIRAALDVADGRVTAVLPEDITEGPVFSPVDVDGDALVQVMDEANVQVQSLIWEHGAYGDPTSPFMPHLDLDGTVAEFVPGQGPVMEESLRVQGEDGNPPWPDEEFYKPGDHEGCTCAWGYEFSDGVTLGPES